MTTTMKTLLLPLSLVTACTLPYELDAPPPPQPRPIAVQHPLDLLFVVDNSGSMQEEQATLVRSIVDDRCPIQDLQNVPEAFANASPEILEELAQTCGLAQLLAAIDGDFHIGVITTDVGNCDERVPDIQDPDDLHEATGQRGCLQGGTFLTRDDDIKAGLESAMLGVGTFGSPFERGMEAMKIFLDPNARRAPGCEDDLDGFLRKDGQLMVVFVTDEDDCSHEDGAYGFANELEGEPEGCGEYLEMLFPRSNEDETLTFTATSCYEHPELLAPVGDYTSFLKGLVESGRTQNVYVSVVGGYVGDAENLVSGSCRPTAEGGVDGFCNPAFGNSGSLDACPVEANCCLADGGFRYGALATGVNSEELTGSICAPDFRAPLLPIFFQSELEEQTQQ